MTTRRKRWLAGAGLALTVLVAPASAQRPFLRGQVEDVLAFLPAEQAGGLTLDPKIEHNFLGLLGLELRL